jgi:flagellar biosynthesis protein FliR
VIDFLPVARFALLLVRPAMIVMVAPGFGGTYAPARVKVGLIVLLAIGLAPSVGVPDAAGDVGLAVIIAREVAIGMALALVTRALIVAAEFAGHLSGYQIGFSYGATIDPSSGARHTALATLYGLLAVLTFLGINGHHALIRALTESYVGLPIGAGHIDASLLTAVRNTFALIFTVGLRLAAPIVIVLLIVELAVGLIARTAPALSVQVIGAPLRLIIGLAVLAVLIATVPSVVSSLLTRVIELALQMASAFR